MFPKITYTHLGLSTPVKKIMNQYAILETVQLPKLREYESSLVIYFIFELLYGKYHAAAFFYQNQFLSRILMHWHRKRGHISIAYT